MLKFVAKILFRHDFLLHLLYIHSCLYLLLFMKIGILIFLVFLSFSHNLHAQKASYGHQTAHFRYNEVLQLIANVSSRHHLLVVRPNKKPILHVYDQVLNLQAKKEIADVIPQNCDIQILQLKDHYFLFTHVPKSGKYQLWKVDAQGGTSDMIPQFYKLKTNFKDTNAVIQVSIGNKYIFLMTQVYYEQLGELHIERLKTDHLLQSGTTDRIAFKFNPEYESLQQVMPMGEDFLLLLKSSKNEISQNLLELVKCDLQTGAMNATEFNIYQNLFAQPVISYDPLDSTILVYSMVRAPLMATKLQRSVFMCKLNNSLQPVVPATILKSPNHYSFYSVKGSKYNWLHFLEIKLSLYAPSTMRHFAPPHYRFPDHYVYNDALSRNLGSIRFSIVDEQFKIVKDSLVQVDNKGFIIRPANFGKVQWGNKSYLIMEQQLPNKNTGLLLITAENKKLAMTDLNVYNRYNYVLSQLQLAGDGNCILPYTKNKEAGLMKLKLD